MGQAGEGTDRLAEQAQLHLDRAEASVASARRSLQAAEAGGEGERAVAAELLALERFGWTALHDSPWPGRERANIDHIVVGPGGVVVVDTKNWSAPVTVRRGTLRCGRNRQGSAVESVAAQTGALATLLDPRQRASLRGALCVSHQDVEPSSLAHEVTVVGRQQLNAWLTSLPAQLSPDQVRAVMSRIERGLATAKPSQRRAAARRRAGLRADLLGLAALGALAGVLLAFPEQVGDAWMWVSKVVGSFVADRLTDSLKPPA